MWTNFCHLKGKKLEEPLLMLTNAGAQRNDHCISSRVLPFVSGTRRMTNTSVKALTIMYAAKVPVQFENKDNLCKVWYIIYDPTLHKRSTNVYGPPALQLSSKFAVIVIPKDVNQLASVAKLPARLLMLTGRIWQNAKFEISLTDCLRHLAESTCSRITLWIVLLSQNQNLGKRQLMCYISYAIRYCTSDIMIHGMAPMPKEKAMI